MRTPFIERVERGRVRKHPGVVSERGDPWGFFELAMNNGGTLLRILATPGDDDVPWEHVSVSTRTRVPTWEEMCWVKELFFQDEEAVVQIHPRKSDYVNFHANCLHLWRPLKQELPLPPTLAVGPRTSEEIANEFARVGLKVRKGADMPAKELFGSVLSPEAEVELQGKTVGDLVQREKP